MGRTGISEDVKRRLYAESMGRCMNPTCQKELFSVSGDIIERAHIDAYCETADNSFENLVILCPNCHTEFDKNAAFTSDEVKSWKTIRQQEVQRLFSKKFSSFDDLKEVVTPLLLENKTIFEKYYLGDCKDLWDRFETRILINNRKLKLLFEGNTHLFQRHSEKHYSNLAIISDFILHVKEFELTRPDEEKIRQVLFPAEINSIFGIAPVRDYLLPLTESLEDLISKLKSKNMFDRICMGTEHPYIVIKNGTESEKVFLDDTPRIRQLYYDYKCFRSAKVRLESLNFALKCIRRHGIPFKFIDDSNLREITIGDRKIVFVYEYCLSKAALLTLCPEKNSVIVNLHNWNGASCISSEAYDISNKLDVQLLTMDDAFYEYLEEIKLEQ